jgi:hypothetical protein
MGSTYEARGAPWSHALSLYPVRKIAQTAAKHASRNTAIIEKLTTMLTSDIP